MENHDKDDMDSLFEGMVLFNPSQVTANDAGDGSEPASSARSSVTVEMPFSSSSQPLDENLFSDLTVITPSQSDIVGPDPSSATKSSGGVEKESISVASISRQSSRKKKRAGLRIGYGRDLQQSNDATLVSHSIDTLPPARKSLQSMMDLDRTDPDITEESEDSASVSTSKSDVDLQNRSYSSLEKERELLHDEVKAEAHLKSVQDGDVVSGAAEVKESTQDENFVSGPSEYEEETGKQVKTGEEEQKESAVSFQEKYEHIKAEISDKLRRAQEMVTSISSARKDSRRRRRKAAEEVELASQRYRDLEKQLDEACEAEDFEMADTLSEKLAAADQEKQNLLNILREAEADSDNIDSKMQEVLEFQIASEEECVSLLQQFSRDLSSRKSNIQQEIASHKQRMFFVDKRIPELEAEKKVAASARNFKEAARIATEAKTLITEKERQQVTMEESTLELGKLDQELNEATTKIQEIELLVSSMERELTVTQFQRLHLLATSARAERATALELGDVEEASVLLAEAEAAEFAAKQIQTMHDISIEKVEEMMHISPVSVEGS